MEERQREARRADGLREGGATMRKKENRPDACTASGTASTICDYDSTSVFAGQDMTENELIRTVTEDYLAGIDVDIRRKDRESSDQCGRNKSEIR